MTISWGADAKSRRGAGIFWTIYSQITSMLYLSWAEMGITGAPSATVPAVGRGGEGEGKGVGGRRGEGKGEGRGKGQGGEGKGAGRGGEEWRGLQ